MEKKNNAEKIEQCCVHDERKIKGFFKDYRPLCNFHLGEVEYEGVIYPSVENAYQAAKIIPEARSEFVSCSPAKSQSLWRNYLDKLVDTSPQEWDKRKYAVMKELLLQKFSNDEFCKNLLLDTGEKYLEETNWWGDSYWGVDLGKGGENTLGKLLMEIRKMLRS